MVQIEAVGARPSFPRQSEQSKAFADVSYCPGAQVDAQVALEQRVTEFNRAEEEFGRVLEVWEGYALDEAVRRQGSSGGVISALSIYCLERRDCEMVLHTGKKEDTPWANTTVTSRDRGDVLTRTGSRYAPSSPCEGLGLIEAATRPSVFVGKPCDTAAVMALRGTRRELDSKLDLVLTFFCAGTPASSGAKSLLGKMAANPKQVVSVDYRGEGWPGLFTAKDRAGTTRQTTYDASWSHLTGYRPLRCNLCPDGLGRLADIACGDAWHQYSGDGNPGRSLILVRTEKGRRILAAARAAGYVHLEPSSADAVFSAQPGLLQRRRELFGRLLALRLMGIPIPRFQSFSLRSAWLRQPIATRLKTIVGTLRRGLQRGWWKRSNEPSY